MFISKVRKLYSYFTDFTEENKQPVQQVECFDWLFLNAQIQKPLQISRLINRDSKILDIERDL